MRLPENTEYMIMINMPVPPPDLLAKALGRGFVAGLAKRAGEHRIGAAYITEMVAILQEVYANSLPSDL
jgi:hypothetical protein